MVNGIMEMGSRVSANTLEIEYQDHEILFLLDLDCPGAKRTVEDVGFFIKSF